MLQRMARAGRWLLEAARSARGRAAVIVLAAAVLVGPATDPVIAEMDGALLQEIIQRHRLNPQQAAAFSALYMRYLPLWRTSQAGETPAEIRHAILKTYWGSRWRIDCSATPAYVAATQSWRPWGVLAGGMSAAGLLGAFLLAATGGPRSG